MIGRFFVTKRPLLSHFSRTKNMIKKLTFSAVLLTMFILASNSANAGYLDLSNNSHIADNLGYLKSAVAKNTAEDVVEPTPTPITVNTETVKTAPKTNSIATHIVMASAYSSTPDQTDSTPFITAWGTQVRDGIIAANFLPFGTMVKMPELYGDKIFVVEDRMNKRYTYKIDVWFPERVQAMEFGNKKVKIEIVAKL